MPSLIIYAQPNKHDEALKAWGKEVKRDIHWKQFKAPAESVYRSVCFSLGWDFIRYDKVKNEIVVAAY